MAARQPEKTLGPGKVKQSKLSQDEEWPSIPASFFIDPIPTPQASKEGGLLPPLPLSVDPLISLPDQRTKNPRRGANHNKNRKKKPKESTASQICNLPPTLVNPCTEMKAPPHPPLPPERVDGCKGGREGAQEILKSTQAKIRRRGGMCKEEGGPPVQAD
ncbi:MAG: hypothetical protein GY696_40020, partial [Gammaproteobacteria bacterium]|nr:hypothetical protein [Gammaproteobacteria bacterium]